MDPRELVAMVRSGEVPRAVWVEALAAEKKPAKLDLTAFIRSCEIGF